jgi:hypothetical protein
MDAKALLTLLDEELGKENSRKSIAETAGVARVNYYRVLKTGNITLPRFLKLIELGKTTLAEFAAMAEGKTLVQGTVLELHFNNEKLQLEIDYLKRLLQACEDSKK